jgi:hypothetical protein
MQYYRYRDFSLTGQYDLDLHSQEACQIVLHMSVLELISTG